MNLDKCIQTRRSIRNFSDKKVGNEQIKEIIKAGIRAPSGGNYQPWYFVVVQNEQTIENMRKIINPNPNIKISKYALLFNAKTVISVCVDLTKTYLNSKCSDEIDKLLDSVEIISVGACIENMLLRIHDLGLGACWCRVGYTVRKPFEELLDIRSPYYLVANIALGYQMENIDRPNPRKDLDSVYRIKY